MWRYRNLSGGKILWRKKVAESTIWRKNSSNVAENIFKIHCIEKKLKYRLVKSWNMAVWRRKMAEFSKNIENGRRPFSKSGHYGCRLLQKSCKPAGEFAIIHGIFGQELLPLLYPQFVLADSIFVQLTNLICQNRVPTVYNYVSD